MRKYTIVGLGLLLGLGVAWAEDGARLGNGQRPPRAATRPAALLEALTGARPRLQAAIDASRELAAKDEEPDTKELERAAAAMAPAENFPDGDAVKRFPRASHIARYMAARPWSEYYSPWHVRQRTEVQPQYPPRWADAAALRELLQDQDPAMRAVAAEALATLHQPEDVARLAALLGDQAAAPPYLGHNASRSAEAFPGTWGTSAADGIVLTRSWRKETVAQCAQRALELMTGRRFEDKGAFERWWKVNSGGRDCLWYWQQRLDRELNEADIATSHSRLHQRPDEPWERYQARQRALNSAARAEAHRAIAAELRQLSPEVEAKVRLLAASRRAGGAPITGSEAQSWPGPPELRVSSERLLDLLDRKDLWADVPWDEQGMYNLLVERLGMWAGVLFRPAAVPRLRAALERERDRLWWSGRAGMIIGISRLLPNGAEGKLDDPSTRDGFLRQAVLNEPDLFVRDYCARELTGVGLPANAPFLKDVAFATQKDDLDNRLTQGILQALAQPPLTPQKRDLLVELLLDRRFEPFWTRANTRMGMDMCRQYGIWAVNAHAGREVVGNALKYRLVDPAQSEKALTDLRQLIAGLRQREERPRGNLAHDQGP